MGWSSLNSNREESPVQRSSWSREIETEEGEEHQKIKVPSHLVRGEEETPLLKRNSFYDLDQEEGTMKDTLGILIHNLRSMNGIQLRESITASN